MTDADLAFLAQDAYTPPQSFHFGDVCGTLRWASPKEPVVTFQGTHDVAQWLTDLDAIPEHDPDLGWCHRGFLLGARASLEWVRTACKAYPATLVGHSLGGALAALSGALLRASGHPVAQVVTFGCPRVGFRPVQLALQGTPCRRYVHGDDIVPTVPDYFNHHVAECIQLDGCLAGSRLGNHSINLYRKALEHDA